MCKHHIPLPDGANVTTCVFICIACHLEVFSAPQPYFVSAPTTYCVTYLSLFAQGFYNGTNAILNRNPSDWKTPLSAALKVNADYQMTAKSHILATPLLVLHFILSSIRPNGNPARFMGDSMGEYLPDGCFQYEEVSFDLTTDTQVALHGNQMNRLVKELQQ